MATIRKGNDREIKFGSLYFLKFPLRLFQGFPISRLVVKNPPAQCRGLERRGFDPWMGEDPLDEDMATHSIVLAWRIPGMGEPGGLLSMGSYRVGHD